MKNESSNAVEICEAGYSKISPLEIMQLYRQVENERGVYYEINENQISFYRDKKKAGTLSCIESFVREIEKGGAPFFLETVKKSMLLRRGGIARFYGYMNAFLSEYSSEKIYSPYVQEFFRVCIEKMKLTSTDFPEDPYRPIVSGDKQGWVVFNQIVKEISNSVKSRVFKRKVYARAEALRKGFNRTKEYVDKLFSKYARLLVLRIDFSFQYDEDGNSISLEEAQNKFALFLRNKRSKVLYKNLVGYIWRLEFGEKKGYHYHLFFFFDGSRVQKDSYLARMIGEDWRSVTGGKGRYFNCNAKAEKGEYRDVGIGKVSHSDLSKREILLSVLSYLYKSDQLIKEKFSEYTKTWSKGGMPNASSGLGRPRRVRLG